MPVAFVDFTNGTAMSTAAVKAELTKARDYVNAVDEGDVADDSLDFTHIYKPESYGFPVRGTIGTLQRLHGHSILVANGYGRLGTTALGRVSLYPEHQTEDNLQPVPGLHHRVLIDKSSIPRPTIATLRYSFDYVTNFNRATGGFAYGTNPIGHFAVFDHDVTAGTIVELAGTRRRFHPGNPGDAAAADLQPTEGSNTIQRIEISHQAIYTLRGPHDFFVAFVLLGPAQPTAFQIIVIRRNRVIELSSG